MHRIYKKLQKQGRVPNIAGASGLKPSLSDSLWCAGGPWKAAYSRGVSGAGCGLTDSSNLPAKTKFSGSENGDGAPGRGGTPPMPAGKQKGKQKSQDDNFRLWMVNRQVTARFPVPACQEVGRNDLGFSD